MKFIPATTVPPPVPLTLLQANRAHSEAKSAVVSASVDRTYFDLEGDLPNSAAVS
jgi:hypothetical protein